ncbi:MAG: tyrosine-type recombinase/integrase, partial [Candidatus Latescibacteria bacterium]|nr:tyrosine-type recombinase/integrase [Candidatus Latescibacterota bacterium]NIM22485.1 tyrosine-type recombinase/integrase [Candidatus Latescibacterota bacterium]NIM66545.1 tyrosine-type recombinase/integrase [Candidatus Latescibacterota bacterium]NIO03026.1 tyrosine-type recombinase/integrase [Candidatus Latescibacterota bacterium]NIO78689.1 tyrosine-type recombinase/integrase [Candidatus Latescibacterota bacterium]
MLREKFAREIMEDVIQHYLDHLRDERDVSPHTLRNYASDLRQFHRFLLDREGLRHGNEKVDFRKIDLQEVRAYLGSLAKVSRKSSIGRKIAALRGFFFRYLVKGKVIERDPFALIGVPKQEKPLPTFLSVDDVFRLLGGFKGNGPLNLRDRAVLEVLYSTGVRVSELVGLNWSDVDFQLGIVRVVGKGSKERIVPIGEV